MSIKPGQLIKYNGEMILAENLPRNTSKRAVCICDKCGKETSRILRTYYNAIEKHNNVYLCKECFNNDKELLKEKAARTKQTNLNKYGVESPMQVKEIQDKLSKIIMDKYGVSYPGQIAEGREKRKKTCLDKYGVENPLVLSDNNNAHSAEARQKAVNTQRERYGGVGFELEENRKKGLKSLLESGNILTSSQQKNVFEMLKNMYPDSNCELNKPCGDSLALDTAININGVLIDVECDGAYWHKDKQKDRQRDEVVKKLGYKVLRIKFSKLTPTEQELKSSIEKLITTDHSYYELILKDYKQQLT